MKSRKPAESFAPHELQRFILPITISSVAILVFLIVDDLLNGPPLNANLIIYSSVVITCTLINNSVITHTANFRQSYGWLNAALTGIGLGLLPYVLPAPLKEVSHILIPLAIIAVAIISGRPYAYTTLAEILIFDLYYAFHMKFSIFTLSFGMPFIISIGLMEAVLYI